jgi:magnesium transporter
MDRVPRPLIAGIEEDLLPLLEDRRDAALRNILINLHPADIADLIASLSDEDYQRFLFDMIADPETASAVLIELPPPVRENVLEDISHDELADLLEEMESDDAADLVQELPDEEAEQVLSAIEPAELAAVRPLLEHAEDTAGGLMATEALTVDVDGTVGDAREVVRAHADEVGSFFELYVVDRDRRLRGIVRLKDLVLKTSHTRIREAMESDPVTVPAGMDQEQVAEMFRRYDLVSVPVVGPEGRFLGRITVDDVVDVVHEEAAEDLARIAGTFESEFDEPSVRRVSLLRLPWILISLFGGLLAGAVLRHFTGALGGTALLLVAFVPVITAMGGNAGSQAAITMVRRLALHRVGAMEIGSIVLREARVGLLLGVVCGAIVGTVALIVEGSGYYGLVVGVAMSVAILVAATMGSLVPLVFHRLRVDPAIATGPFVSMSNDVVGLFIYFGLATMLLQLGGTFGPG